LLQNKFWFYFRIFQNNFQSKHSPRRQKFTESGHPDWNAETMSARRCEICFERTNLLPLLLTVKKIQTQKSEIHEFQDPLIRLLNLKLYNACVIVEYQERF
jgi:hypothetical protein